MPSPAPALPRFVDLVRVSSAGQAARETPEDQRAALEQLRTHRPGVLVERIDLQVSGAAAGVDRPDLARLAELGRAKAFDELRVRHLDRLTRHADPRERFAVYGIVADAGAVIVDASGRVIDPRTEMGEVGYYLDTLMAARERARILERTRAGKDRAAAAGRLVHGRPPFGRTWDRASGRWGVDEEAAAVYRRLFDLCLSGHSIRRICEVLDADGIPTPAGARWHTSTVSRMLRDPVAIGEYRTHGRTIAIPPIVDEKTFAAAADRLRAGAQWSGPRPTHPALLRKLLTCGACGSSMYVTKGGKWAARHHYYYCASGDQGCNTYHRVEVLDQVVRGVVEEWLRRPAPLRAAAAQDRPADDLEAAAREEQEARGELADLARQEERLARLLRRELVTEKTGEKQLQEIGRLRAAAEAQLAAARARAASAERRSQVAAELEARVVELRAGLGEATFADWRALLEILFPRTPTTWIRVSPDGEVDLRGALSLDVAGEAALEQAAEASTARVIPLRLGARSRR